MENYISLFNSHAEYEAAKNTLVLLSPISN